MWKDCIGCGYRRRASPGPLVGGRPPLGPTSDSCSLCVKSIVSCEGGRGRQGEKVAKEQSVASLPTSGAPGPGTSLPLLPSAPGGQGPLAGPFCLGPMPACPHPSLLPSPLGRPWSPEPVQRGACWAGRLSRLVGRDTFLMRGGVRAPHPPPSFPSSSLSCQCACEIRGVPVRMQIPGPHSRESEVWTEALGSAF